MSAKLRFVLFSLISLSFFFGFSHSLFPEFHKYDFERLNIFFFNLCCCGTVILYYTEAKRELSEKSALFFILSFIYALSTFFNYYILTMIISFVLLIIVEKVRIKRFSFFPSNFFDSSVSVSIKFHHASLLCLSIALIFSVLAIINEEYYKILFFSKLKLNAFFLGFSFPVSLISFSLIFSFMNENANALIERLKNISFWIINLGVITLFIFILSERLFFQLITAFLLFLGVIIIFYLFYKLSLPSSRKKILMSGMLFLIASAISGILYIMINLLYGYDVFDMRFIARIHAFIALYGWNLSGIIIICRYEDFPAHIDLKKIFPLHWAALALFVPLGYYIPLFALLVSALFSFVLFRFFLPSAR